MITRRNFVQLSAAALPMLSPAMHAQKRITPVGLQLSTISKLARVDLPGTLRDIRSIGFNEVEMFNVGYNLPAATLRSMIVDAGLLPPVSAHFDYADIGTQLDYAKALGLQYAVSPMLPMAMRSDEASFHVAAKKFNEWGQRAADLGMKFAWHNHDYEFRPYETGKTGYDILLSETDPKLVFFELDCYWLTQAGQNPVAMLNRLGKRAVMLHMKDRKAGFPTSFDMTEPSAHFTEVGTGGIDYAAIIAKAKSLGIEHFYVEHDRIGDQPLASLRISYANARKLLA